MALAVPVALVPAVGLVGPVVWLVRPATRKTVRTEPVAKPASAAVLVQMVLAKTVVVARVWAVRFLFATAVA